MQTVYVDVLLVLNWVIDYLLLRLTAHFLRLSVSRKRLVLGAGVGAFGALVILLPPLPWGLDVLVKLLLSAAVIAAAFGVKSPRAFLRAGLSFFFLSFAFAGVLVAVWAVFAPQGLFVKNSVVYFDVPPLLLIFLALGVYVFLRIVQRLCGRGAVKDTACTLKLTLGGAHASLSARVDTGCTLKEPFSGLPVIVVAGTALPRPGTPPRIIPYASVGGEGLLPAWRPESVCLQFPDKEIHPSLCYVAFSERPLSGAVQALLPPDLLEDGDVHPIQKEDRRESQTVHPKIPQKPVEKASLPAVFPPRRLHQRPGDTSAAPDARGGSAGVPKHRAGSPRRARAFDYPQPAPRRVHRPQIRILWCRHRGPDFHRHDRPD